MSRRRVIAAARRDTIGSMVIARGRLGDGGLVVSRLGLGLAALGRPGYITLGRSADLPAERTVEALYARTAEVLDAAYDAGVRYVDAARSYGRAEEFLARWLRERGHGREQVTAGSKWGYRYTAGWQVDASLHEEKELSLERFRTQLAETRALLGDALALYQIHSATAESGVLQDEPLLRALVEARRTGAVRALGLTLSGVGSRHTLELALATRIDGERVFDAVQATFNVLEPSLRDVLGEARAAGMGVILKEVHANGRLTPANLLPADQPLRRRLAEIADRCSLSADQLAIAFAASLVAADVVLSGAVTTAQLRSHAAGIAVELDAATLAELAELAEPPEAYWRARSALPWH
ncbi:MAG: aldo/keto reductase [Thermodesulfobacteriota bacterium]